MMTLDDMLHEIKKIAWELFKRASNDEEFLDRSDVIDDADTIISLIHKAEDEGVTLSLSLPILEEEDDE